MDKPSTRDFLIRNMPIEVYELLEQAARDHHRSKTQEAIMVLANGLSPSKRPLQQPTPLRWKTKPSSKFIKNAIEEGRE